MNLEPVAKFEPKKEFWKFGGVSEQKFLSKVQAGDILLFRGTSIGHSVVRGITGGHFDHVGLVIKDELD